MRLYDKLRSDYKNVTSEIDARLKRKYEVEFMKKTKPVKFDIRC